MFAPRLVELDHALLLKQGALGEAAGKAVVPCLLPQGRVKGNHEQLDSTAVVCCRSSSSALRPPPPGNGAVVQRNDSPGMHGDLPQGPNLCISSALVGGCNISLKG